MADAMIEAKTSILKLSVEVDTLLPGVWTAAGTYWDMNLCFFGARDRAGLVTAKRHLCGGLCDQTAKWALRRTTHVIETISGIAPTYFRGIPDPRVIASNFTSGIKSMDCHTWSIPDLFSN
jgi:hypothetical protein